MTPLTWAVLVLAVIAIAAVFAFEETRVHEARRDEQSWHKRACHHGGTSFQPDEDDGSRR